MRTPGIMRSSGSCEVGRRPHHGQATRHAREITMPAQLFTRRHLGLLTVLCLAPAGPVLAQTATPGSGTPATGTPARVRATIDTVNANGLVLTTRAGEKL